MHIKTDITLPPLRWGGQVWGGVLLGVGAGVDTHTHTHDVGAHRQTELLARPSQMLSDCPEAPYSAS